MDGFPYSYVLRNVQKLTLEKIDEIYDEEQRYYCVDDDYKQVIDQLSRMIEILLDAGHSLKMLLKWSAILSLNR